MKPSPNQAVILDAERNLTSNMLVQACAGSGKTTTLRLLCEQIPANKTVVAICFAKVNAEDFKKKLPARVDASTMHSLGFKIIRENRSGVSIDKHKQSRIITSLFQPARSRTMEQKIRASATERVTPILNANQADLKNPDEVLDIIEQFIPDLQYNDISQLIKDVDEYLGRCRSETKSISFDDMIDHVIHGKLYGQTNYDVILGDEVQDWTKQQAAFAWQMANNLSAMARPSSPLDDLLGLAPPSSSNPLGRPTASRVILVGDRKQAIYAFRGADLNSMDVLGKRFEALELPLSVCYRCPRSVVAEAQKIVGEHFIQPREGAPEGVVHRIELRNSMDAFDKLPAGTLVIARTNGILVKMALRAIIQNRKALVRGRDIGEALVKALQKFSKESEDLGDVLAEAREWYVKNVTRLVDRDRIGQATALMDQFMCLEVIIEAAEDYPSAIRRIESLFSDDTSPGLTLSSIHKAKGLEENIVAILGPDQIPHPMAIRSGNAAMIEQEWNMLYVAVTRAMQELYLLPLGNQTSSAGALDRFLVMETANVAATKAKAKAKTDEGTEE